MGSLKSALVKIGELRRRLHACPEISFEEKETSQAVARWLEEHGVKITTGIAGTGILAEVQATNPGPCRLFRADLDAIGTDNTGHEVNLGPRVGPAPDAPEARARHGCGHDGHTAMLAGAIVELAQNPDSWVGSVYAIFQPAEEIGEGAAKMLEDKRISELPIDVAYAIHNQPGMELGRIAIATGVSALASTGLVVSVSGRTTHASTPHKGNAAISALSTIVREILALPSHVLPFGSSVLLTPTYLDAGKRQFGRVPPHGELGLVVRSDRDEWLEEILSQAKKRIDALASSYGLEATMTKIEPFPATINNLEVVELARESLEKSGFDVQLRDEAQPWSEDFGHFLLRWPGALILLGSGEDHPSLHAVDYEFPDGLLDPGMRLWMSLAGWCEVGSG